MQPADRSASHGPLVRVRSILPRWWRRTRLRASPRDSNLSVRTTERSTRADHEGATLHEVTEPHAALVACRSSSQRLSFGEKSERVDRHDQGLEPFQPATAGSIRDPASSISGDFGAGGLLRTTFPRPSSTHGGLGVRLCSPESGRDVDALSSFRRLGSTSRRLVSESRSWAVPQRTH